MTKLCIMIIAGYIASLLIGISLGLIGGGGSILTVPVLVYLFGVSPIQATAYSLFVVGTTSLIGSWSKFQQGLVNIKTAFVFGAPSIIAVYVTRKWILPIIPDVIFSFEHFTLSKNIFLLLIFALLMVFAAFSMLNDSKVIKPKNQKFNYPLILLEGAIVGMVTGLVGAGGGFLIIPALVLLTGLPMKEAVGTSLLIIAIKSLIGFTGDLGHFSMNWELLITVTGLAIAGIFIGNKLSSKINGQMLKKGFGVFVLLMGAYILIKELFL